MAGPRARQCGLWRNTIYGHYAKGISTRLLAIHLANLEFFFAHTTAKRLGFCVRRRGRPPNEFRLALAERRHRGEESTGVRQLLGLLRHRQHRRTMGA